MTRPFQFSTQDRSALYHLNPAEAVAPAMRGQHDALSRPADADIAGSLYELLPRGPAWATPDLEAFDTKTRLAGYLRGLAGQITALYRRIFDLSQESTAVTLAESLEDWELEYGLPDPCFGENQTFEKRLRALILRIRGAGVITPLDYVELARSAGYTILIEEPHPFEAGVSGAGDVYWEIAGREEIEYFWIVRVPNVAVDYFFAGESEAGVTPLLELSLPDDLICLFRALSPAWTRVIFGV
jgi:uncharacterized protein YmfQ (DUF2313 family)